MRPFVVDQRIGFIRDVISNLPNESKLMISNYINDAHNAQPLEDVEYPVDED